MNGQTFREFYEERHGQYPGVEGECFTDVMERLADTMADYIDGKLRQRVIEETAAGYNVLDAVTAKPVWVSMNYKTSEIERSGS